MEELAPLLEQLAVQMNTTVEFLWGVMVRQANVFVVSYIAGLVLTILFAFILYRSLKSFSYWVQQEEDSWQCWASFVIAILSSVIVVVRVVLLMKGLNDVFTALLNPEYWALQQILEHIGR